MRCPACDTANLMGNDECTYCGFPLNAMDGPVPLDRVEGSIMFDPVETLQPRFPVTVPMTTTLDRVVELMKQANVGAVLVTDADNRLAGILTERDVLMKIAGRVDLHSAIVGDFMSANPESVQPTDPLAFALGKMVAGGYRHIPVVDAGEVCGMVSIRDALNHIVTICQDV